MARLCTFDKRFFKSWSKDMAYVLGFLFADGNIIKTKRGTHFVSFYTCDYDLLFSIREKIASTHKISLRQSKSGRVFRIQIGSIELYQDLIKLGLSPNKSKRMILPKIPNIYFKDFVRGYFDGDGNVWVGLINKKRAKPNKVIQVSFTSGCKEFLQALGGSLRVRGLEGGSIYPIKNKACYRLSFGVGDSWNLYKIMYNIADCLHLPRKKKVFDKYFKMRP